MKYAVEVTASAERDSYEAYATMATYYAFAVHDWFDSLVRAIQDLTDSPQRFPIAPESSDVGKEIRQSVVQGYALLFEIQNDRVNVLHIRAAAERRGFAPESEIPF